MIFRWLYDSAYSNSKSSLSVCPGLYYGVISTVLNLIFWYFPSLLSVFYELSCTSALFCPPIHMLSISYHFLVLGLCSCQLPTRPPTPTYYFCNQRYSSCLHNVNVFKQPWQDLSKHIIFKVTISCFFWQIEPIGFK